MKKVLLILACLFMVNATVLADREKSIQISELPTAAQTFIKEHFSDLKVALAKMESGLLDKSYDVIFTNGVKLEFDKSGDWTEVKCKGSSVPIEIVPQEIIDYVSANYSGQKIVEIEREDKVHEIKLSGGLEIKFNKKYQVIDIDD